eukprot:g1142.t1 g1142   contig10:1468593-1470029(+)
MVYMSPDPYHTAFTESLDTCHLDVTQHPTGGMELRYEADRLILTGTQPGSRAAKLPRWQSRLKHAWLVRVNDQDVHTPDDISQALLIAQTKGIQTISLLFAHSEIKHGLTNDGLPQCSVDQLNNRLLLRPSNQDLFGMMPDFTMDQSVLPSQSHNDCCQYRDDSDLDDVINQVSRVLKLTRGKLRKQSDWDDWRQAEWLQLDQYNEQGMFGTPVPCTDSTTAFFLVWTYVLKVLDGRKKARCTCDGSKRDGKAKVLDHTYANCVEQTGARIFYAASAVENLMIFGSDVSNAFSIAPSPKQGCYIRPDQAFHDLWTIHKRRPPIPPSYIIPVERAMQGHPECPRLWEKHIDSIIKDVLQFRPTTQEPCLYVGEIDGTRVLFLRQVDDFSVACQNARIACRYSVGYARLGTLHPPQTDGTCHTLQWYGYHTDSTLREDMSVRIHQTSDSIKSDPNVCIRIRIDQLGLGSPNIQTRSPKCT